MPCGVLGEPEAELVHAQRALEAAESSANTYLRAMSLSALGQAHVAGGRWQDALDALSELAAAIRANRAAPLVETDTLALLAEAQLGAGDAATARASASDAIAVAQRYRRPLSELRGYLAQARVLAASDDGDGARAALAAARALVDRTGAVMFTPFLDAVTAQLASRRRGA
jgi:hypothetical protein